MGITKEQAEIAHMEAETEKFKAEASTLRRSWMTLVGTLVTAAAPVLAGFIGYQVGDKGKAVVEERLENAEREKGDVERRLGKVQTAKDALVVKSKEALSAPSEMTKERLEAAVLDAVAESGMPAAEPTDIRLGAAIQQLYASTPSDRIMAYETIVKSFASDPQLVSKLIEYGDSHMDNQNGIYNTLVVLSHINLRDRPSQEIQRIKNFAGRARSNGARTSERVDKLLSRLP